MSNVNWKLTFYPKCVFCGDLCWCSAAPASPPSSLCNFIGQPVVNHSRDTFNVILLASCGILLHFYWLLYLLVTRETPALTVMSYVVTPFLLESSRVQKSRIRSSTGTQNGTLNNHLFELVQQPTRHLRVLHTHKMSSENLDSDTQVDYEDEKQVGFCLLSWCC